MISVVQDTEVKFLSVGWVSVDTVVAAVQYKDLVSLYQRSIDGIYTNWRRISSDIRFDDELPHTITNQDAMDDMLCKEWEKAEEGGRNFVVYLDDPIHSRTMRRDFQEDLADGAALVITSAGEDREGNLILTAHPRRFLAESLDVRAATEMFLKPYEIRLNP